MTTIFSTLGCNVGGLKRLPVQSRAPWYAHIQDQLALLQEWHDALLVTLDGDAAQWAYLVNAPAKWRNSTESAFCRAFRDTGHELSMAWRKKDAVMFSDMIDRLFLTRTEYQAKKGTR